ncbi:MAG: metallophosphoesterase [Ignavibacteria bacterium]
MNENKNLKTIKRLPMVNWFDIGQLLRTGFRVIFSKIIGEHSDKRIIQALASTRKEFFNYTHFHKVFGESIISESDNLREEIWLDYISDTGDGWNPTYAVAYYASSPELQLKYKEKVFDTKRGDVLIFGGDEVYPTPSKQNYKDRLITPYETAFGDDEPKRKPHVFAIPGNHDWYDGLASFTRIFCSDLNRSFAGWVTRQRRSYFALKLPGNWWLLGSDGQLQSNIDTPQIEYFRKIADKFMKEGDRVILCISEPNWIFAAKYKKFGELYEESDLLYLQNEILAKKNVDIKVFLAGDLHHYRRHEEIKAFEPEAKVQKITSGGGGSFLHPTHDIEVNNISEEYGMGKKTRRFFSLKESYPDIKTSKRLTFQNLLFPFLNPGFGIVTAILYLLTAWMVLSTLDLKTFEVPSGFLNNFTKAATITFYAFMQNPFVAIWLVMVLITFIVFTDTHSKIYRYAGGFLHCWTHFIAIFYIAWGSAIFASYLFKGDETFTFLIAMLLIFIMGWVVGSAIMGIYLFISQYFFGRHSEESFSAIKIEDYKNFLRLHIAVDGTLSIYPIKIQKCPQRWRNRYNKEKDKIKSYIVPKDGSAAELIESPIILRPRKS